MKGELTMKMKKACEATGLTERAIRLYLSKNLIAPRQINGIIDFQDEDIQRLKDIALLRQLDFTIEQIAGMLHNPDTIASVIRCRMDCAQANAEREAEVGSVLRRMEGKEPASLHAAAEQIRACCTGASEPDFRQFDEMSDEDYHVERTAAYRDVLRQERRDSARRRLTGIVCAAAAVAAIAAMFFSYPRVRGFIPTGPLTMLEICGDGRAVVSIDDARMAEFFGKDEITVPYHIFGVTANEGDKYERGCQLAVELTNFDLARMGVNPLQTMRTRSEEINHAWTKWIVQSLLDGAAEGGATLWINEISGLRPLIRTDYME